jgi:hypothetical protein
MKAIPRLEFVMTQLSIVTFRTPAIFPSQNLTALEAELRRQFVTVIFSQGLAGPNQSME